jgi:hypothetical protein
MVIDENWKKYKKETKRKYERLIEKIGYQNMNLRLQTKVINIVINIL